MSLDTIYTHTLMPQGSALRGRGPNVLICEGTRQRQISQSKKRPPRSGARWRQQRAQERGGGSLRHGGWRNANQ